MVNDELLERGHESSMKDTFNLDTKPTKSYDSPAKKVCRLSLFMHIASLLNYDLSLLLHLLLFISPDLVVVFNSLEDSTFFSRVSFDHQTSLRKTKQLQCH